MTEQRLILLSLNELNFDYVIKYLKFKKLDNLKILSNSIKITTSENEYKNLEPWIQWPSIYTGKKAQEHKIFRLGDIVNYKEQTIFNEFEDLGLNVGAISSMNLNNNLKHPKYFIPDPWTHTKSDKNFWSKLIHSTISKFVIRNSALKFNIVDLFNLLIIFLKFANFKNYLIYLKFFFTGFKYKWRLALFLDLLLNDIHLKYFKTYKPNFSNVFFNGIAHIQHHFFFNSKVIDNNIKNPKWYLKENMDPIAEGLEIYDRILEDYLDNNNFKLVIATGLTQVPYDILKFYYKIHSHSQFFKKLNIEYEKIQELMSRDFIIYFNNEQIAKDNEIILANLKLKNKNIFKIDNRGSSLFVTLVYPDEIKKNDFIETKKIDLFKYVSFVAVKNGMHNQKGYYYDNFSKNINNNFKIEEIKNIIIGLFK